MNKLRGIVVAWALAGTFLLAGLSVFSAFLGPASARVFFNSTPMIAFWAAMLALLALSLVACRAVRRSAWMLAIHLGLGLVIFGAMWGSDRAHKLRSHWLGHDKIPAGEVSLAPGDSARLGELTLELAAARVDYYPADKPRWQFYFETSNPAGQVISRTPIRPKSGQAVELGDSGIQLRLLEYIEQNPARDRNGLLPPPIVKMEFLRAGVAGQLAMAAKENSRRELLRLMLFDTEQDWLQAGRPTLMLSPDQAVRRYQAELVVFSQAGFLARKTVEINKPMHCGGYHFYLVHSDPTGREVVIMARSDSGLGIVYAGLALLLAGLIGRLWLGPIWRKISTRKKAGGPR